MNWLPETTHFNRNTNKILCRQICSSILFFRFLFWIFLVFRLWGLGHTNTDDSNNTNNKITLQQCPTLATRIGWMLYFSSYSTTALAHTNNNTNHAYMSSRLSSLCFRLFLLCCCCLGASTRHTPTTKPTNDKQKIEQQKNTTIAINAVCSVLVTKPKPTSHGQLRRCQCGGMCIVI